MQPLTHFFIALLPVVVFVALRDRTYPSRKLVFVVFFGSQFPDLIDKPLAHLFFLIPNGRMFTHSIIVAIPVTVTVLLVVKRTGHLKEGVAFGVAYLSHIAADFGPRLLRPSPQLPVDMFWPLFPVEVTSVPYWAGPNSINIKLWSLFSGALLMLTVAFVLLEIRE